MSRATSVTQHITRQQITQNAVQWLFRILLAAVLAFSLVPTYAFAQTDGMQKGSESTQAVQTAQSAQDSQTDAAKGEATSNAQSKVGADRQDNAVSQSGEQKVGTSQAKEKSSENSVTQVQSVDKSHGSDAATNADTVTKKEKASNDAQSKSASSNKGAAKSKVVALAEESEAPQWPTTEDPADKGTSVSSLAPGAYKVDAHLFAAFKVSPTRILYPDLVDSTVKANLTVGSQENPKVELSIPLKLGTLKLSSFGLGSNVTVSQVSNNSLSVVLGDLSGRYILTNTNIVLGAYTITEVYLAVDLANAKTADEQALADARSEVQKLVTEAQKELDETKVSTDGSEVEKTDMWVSSAAQSSLASKQADAQKMVLESPDASLETINSCKDNLAQALTDFRSAKKAGTKLTAEEQAHEDAKTKLQAAINKAEKELAATKVSKDGSDVAPSEYWVTKNTALSVQNWVNSGKTALANKNTVTNMLNHYTSMIESNLSKFAAAKKLGKTPEQRAKEKQEIAEARAKLQEALNKAQKELDSLVISVDGSDVDSDVMWVTDSSTKGLKTSIAYAKNILGATNPVIGNLNRGITQINNNLESIEKQKKPGTKVVWPAELRDKGSASAGTVAVGTYEVEVGLFVKDAASTTVQTENNKTQLVNLVDKNSKATLNVPATGSSEATLTLPKLKDGVEITGFGKAEGVKLVESASGQYSVKLSELTGQYAFKDAKITMNGRALTGLYLAADFAKTVKKEAPKRIAAGTYTVTANIGLTAAEAKAAGFGVLENIAGSAATAYMTNPNNPVGTKDDNGNVEAKVPTSPMSKNATLVVSRDGTMKLTIPVRNPVFTMQRVGTNDELGTIDYTVKEGTYGNYSSRVHSITVTLPSTEEKDYVLANCAFHPTILASIPMYATAMTAPMHLTVGDLSDLPVWEPSKAVVPTAKAGLTYNGLKQQGVYEGEGYTLSGNVSAKDAGNYAATATLKKDYTWSDGSTGSKTINWSIAKAPLTAAYKSETVIEGATPAYAVGVTGFVGNDTRANVTRSDSSFAMPTVTPVDAGSLKAGYRQSLIPAGGKAKNYKFSYTAGLLTVKAAGRQTDSLASGTYTITANLAMPGQYNPVIKGLTVYANNPDNPFGPTLDENKASEVKNSIPSSPQSMNARLIVQKDGTRTLVLPVKNPIFTLQVLGTCSDVSNIRTERVKPSAGGGQFSGSYGKRSDRIHMVALDLPTAAASKGMLSYNFTNSKLYAVPLDLELAPSGSIALQLSVDMDSLKKTSDSTNLPAFAQTKKNNSNYGKNSGNNSENPNSENNNSGTTTPSVKPSPAKPSAPANKAKRGHLAQGTYRVSANIWVNKATSGLPLQPHFTSAAFPPMNPVSKNATLRVDANGRAAVTVPIVIQSRVMSVCSISGLNIVSSSRNSSGGLSSITIDLGVLDSTASITKSCTASVRLGSLASTIIGGERERTWQVTFQVNFDGVPSSGGGVIPAAARALMDNAGSDGLAADADEQAAEAEEAALSALENGSAQGAAGSGFVSGVGSGSGAGNGAGSDSGAGGSSVPLPLTVGGAVIGVGAAGTGVFFGIRALLRALGFLKV